MTDYEFYTGEVELWDEYDEYWSDKDVQEPNIIVGLYFDPLNGRVYEFQNPDSHEKHEKIVDPRSGDVIEFDNSMARILQGELFKCLTKVPMPAEKWAEIRPKYINQDEWTDAWKEATPSNKEHLEELSKEAGRQNRERNKL